MIVVTSFPANTAGPAVADLHAALAALNLPVTKTAEVKRQVLGTATAERLREFQQREGLPATGQVDEATAARLNERLTEWQQLAYEVSGTVYSAATGQPLPDQPVLLVDVDLQGAGRYAGLGHRAELARGGGLEELGETVTDAAGHYRLRFAYRQFAQAERGPADVVAFALGAGGKLLGHSRRTTAASFRRDEAAEPPAATASNLNVLVTDPDQRGPSEFARLDHATAALLREAQLSWATLAERGEQPVFLSQEAAVALEQVRVRGQAARRAAEAGASPPAPHAVPTPTAPLSEELLYGLGREGVVLSWPVLATARPAQLRAALIRAGAANVITLPDDKQVSAFLRQLLAAATELTLQAPAADGEVSLGRALALALPDEAQQRAFVEAHQQFTGSPAEFWGEYLPRQAAFANRPELVRALQLTNQLFALTDGYLPLVEALQGRHRVRSPRELLTWDAPQWAEVLREAGLPAGRSDATAYATGLQQRLNQVYPTARLAELARAGQLSVADEAVGRGLANFLDHALDFDIRRSRVTDFEPVLRQVAGDHAPAVRDELLTVQRLYQISPTPGVLAALRQAGFHSARAVAEVPGETFVAEYASQLGGVELAWASYDRATTLAHAHQQTTLVLTDALDGVMPAAVQSAAGRRAVQQAVAQHLPNYQELFKGVDACACDECRSIFSPAAYLVDLLRFLTRSGPNYHKQRPLSCLLARRPDLQHLPLTCDNTNVVIPYIDLVNEVLEYYTAHGELAAAAAHDVQGATAAELRAAPQYTNSAAYRKLAEQAAYPLSLPYHQPLDALRTYARHLQTSRAELLAAFQPDPVVPYALAAEQLGLAPREFELLTGHSLDGAASQQVTVAAAFGFSSTEELLAEGPAVPELLARTGLRYDELIALLETNFLNPDQAAVNVAATAAGDEGTTVGQGVTGQVALLLAGLLQAGYGAEPGKWLNLHGPLAQHQISVTEFATWGKQHLPAADEVLTLYEPQDLCSLATTRLRTVGGVVAAPNAQPLPASEAARLLKFFDRLRRFVRLWRALQRTYTRPPGIADTDWLLSALGAADITPEVVRQLAAVGELGAALGLPATDLALLWGQLDTQGPASTYARLFRSKAMQQLDTVFEPDSLGRLLTDNTQTLGDHLPALLAAFRLTAAELERVAGTAGLSLAIAPPLTVGTPPPTATANTQLNLGNVSRLYRYVVLARALQLPVAELCDLLELFQEKPFSEWVADQQGFAGAEPARTLGFVQLVAQLKATGQPTAALRYALAGLAEPNSPLALPTEQAQQALLDVRQSLSQLETQVPALDPDTLTDEQLRAQLRLGLEPDVVEQLLGLLAGTLFFSALTDPNLALAEYPLPALGSQVQPDVPGEPTPPDPQPNLKVRYTKASGRLQVQGALTPTEYAYLLELPGASAGWQAAVQALYTKPDQWLQAQLGAVFGPQPDAPAAAVRSQLLDRAAGPLLPVRQKQAMFYAWYRPWLLRHLQGEAVTTRTAALLATDQATATLLMPPDPVALATAWTATGLSAAYFSDPDLSGPSVLRTDLQLDFRWAGPPVPGMSAAHFGVRWQGGVINLNADDTYTFVVEVGQADEQVRLWLDGELVVNKPSGDPRLSWEAERKLAAGQLVRLRLDYGSVGVGTSIRLGWRASRASEPLAATIPAAALVPDAVLMAATATLQAAHRAAELVRGLRLSAPEAQYLTTHSDDFSGFSLLAPTPTGWRRALAYTELRDALAADAGPALVQVFGTAGVAADASLANLTDLLTQLAALGPWTLAEWQAAAAQLALTADDCRHEQRLLDVVRLLQLGTRTGVGTGGLATWLVPVGPAQPGSFDDLDARAARVRRLLKSRYGDEQWLSVSAGLSDELRGRQRTALVDYLLTHPTLRAWGVRDADNLYEYFLLDVQMEPCMDTSRVKQAISAVQLFVSRALLNLESRPDAKGHETGVRPGPGVFDAKRWDWMKNYRVWEANRRVFAYPENWLEPEWRTDKSEFFRALESELLQNDITDDTVETALRAYVAKLGAVANLHVCAMLHDAAPDPTNGSTPSSTLHVFAHTQAQPFQYYYRTQDKYQHWAAWQQLPLDIPYVTDRDEKGNEIAGDHNGVFLLPVKWKNRLFLFWPEFMLKQRAKGTGDVKLAEFADKTPNEVMPTSYWEARLAWSELRNGQWTPKQVSQQFCELASDKLYTYTFQVAEAGSSFAQLLQNNSINSYQVATDRLSLVLFSPCCIAFGVFELIDPHSQVVAVNGMLKCESISEPNASTSQFFQLRHRATMSPLVLEQATLLQQERKYTLLYSGNDAWAPDNKGIYAYHDRADQLFFYHDIAFNRSFFAQPSTVDYWVISIDEPDSVFYGPLKEVGASKVLVPKITPDDRMPSPNEWQLGPKGELIAPSRSNSLAQRRQLKTVELAGIPQGGDGAKVALARMLPPSTAPGGSNQGRAGSSWAIADLTVGGSFSGIGYDRSPKIYGALGHGQLQQLQEPVLSFSTFYHPYAPQFEGLLNQDGLAGLLGTSIDAKLFPDDKGQAKPKALFNDEYSPNSTGPGLHVRKPYPAINLDFSPTGAYSLYNYELFFHLPLFVATRLSKNGQYAQAMRWFHFIFDPTTSDAPKAANPTARYWRVPPFRTDPAEGIESFFRRLKANSATGQKKTLGEENKVIAEWRDHPFEPHRVARDRPVAYMKNVVLKYVDNLVAWGDDLFRRDTMESINEATQLYVLAGHILGPRPQRLPARGTPQPATYAELAPRLDDFGNALVALENLLLYSHALPAPTTHYAGGLPGLGQALYFGVPLNDQLLSRWDTVADRLFKIRHCQNLAGVERHLDLFEPPIDPALLVQATAQGVSLGAVLNNLSGPAPLHRFTYLVQRATELCADVRALGSALLAALEKRDAEELARRRAADEIQLLTLARRLKEHQLVEARTQYQALAKSRETLVARRAHYADLLGIEAEVPAAPLLTQPVSADMQLPEDTKVALLPITADVSLVDSADQGIKLLGREQEEIAKNSDAHKSQQWANRLELLAGIANFYYPNLSINAQPFGVGGSVSYGGSNIGSALSAGAKALQLEGTKSAYEAAQAGRMASYVRRTQEWTLQANQAAHEIMQLDKQLVAAAIRVQLAAHDLRNHDRQVSLSEQAAQFLQRKYTNQELYQWLKEQLLGVYKQSYQLAYDLARQAEKAYQFELGQPGASFIQYDYWDGSHDGLHAGEQLQLALRQLEQAYLSANARAYELTKHVSLVQLAPEALLALKRTGTCLVNLPEELFDLDYPGHYFRRLKSVSLTVPCVAGPYTTVNCTLRLLRNSVRVSTASGAEASDPYARNHDGGVLLDDARFVEHHVAVSAVATSSAQFDSGLFEVNFRDERYLPFEGAGAISQWQLELNGKTHDGQQIIDLSQFDYDTISDVVLHLRYTAREEAGAFRTRAVQHLNALLRQATNQQLPLQRLFDVRHEFATDWQRFFNPVPGQAQKLTLDLRNRFPFLTTGRTLHVNQVRLLAATTRKVALTLHLITGLETSPPKPGGVDVPLSEVPYVGWRQGSPNPSLASTTVPGIWEISYPPASDDGQLPPLTRTELSELLLLVDYHLA